MVWLGHVGDGPACRDGGWGRFWGVLKVWVGLVEISQQLWRLCLWIRSWLRAIEREQQTVCTARLVTLGHCIPAAILRHIHQLHIRYPHCLIVSAVKSRQHSGALSQISANNGGRQVLILLSNVQIVGFILFLFRRGVATAGALHGGPLTRCDTWKAIFGAGQLLDAVPEDTKHATSPYGAIT